MSKYTRQNRLNLYNNATTCYELSGGISRKTRVSKVFWFSLLLGYFLMSYRRGCLIVRRLGFLMARYRVLYKKWRSDYANYLRKNGIQTQNAIHRNKQSSLYRGLKNPTKNGRLLSTQHTGNEKLKTLKPRTRFKIASVRVSKMHKVRSGRDVTSFKRQNRLGTRLKKPYFKRLRTEPIRKTGTRISKPYTRLAGIANKNRVASSSHKNRFGINRVSRNTHSAGRRYRRYRWRSKVVTSNKFCIRNSNLHRPKWFVRQSKTYLPEHQYLLYRHKPWNSSIYRDPSTHAFRFFVVRNKKNLLAGYKYVRALRIVKKYRSNVVKSLIRKKANFFFQIDLLNVGDDDRLIQNNLVVSKKSEFARFLVDYLFDIRYRRKWVRRRKFNHIMNLRKRFSSYYRDLSRWTRIRRYFMKRRRSRRCRAKWGLPIRPFKMSFLNLFSICSVILGASPNTIMDEYRLRRLSMIQGSVVIHRILTHSVYGVSNRTIKKYILGLEKRLGIKMANLSNPLKLYYYFENQLKYFLLYALNITQSVSDRLIREGSVLLGGVPCTSNRYSISSFDFVTINQSIEDPLTKSFSADLAYNNARLWYMWIFMLKSWNRCMGLVYKSIMSNFMHQLYRVYREGRLNLSTTRYISYTDWPYKLRMMHRYRTLLIKITNEMMLTTSESDYFDINLESYYDITPTTYIDRSDSNFGCSITHHNAGWLESSLKLSKQLIIKLTRLQIACKSIKYPLFSRNNHVCRSASRNARRLLLRQGYLYRYTRKFYISGYSRYFKSRFKRWFCLPTTQSQKIIIRSPYHITLPRYFTSFIMRRMRVNTRNYQIWVTSTNLGKTISTHIFLYNFTYDTYRTQLSLLYKNAGGNKLVGNTYFPAWYL